MTTAIFTLETSPGFVGRQAELKFFNNLLDDLKTGRITFPRFLHFYGTAGIGKTTLLTQFIRLCKHRGVAVADVSFEEERMKAPYHVEEPYEAALFIIATKLAHLRIGTTQALLAERAALQTLEMSQNPEERQAAIRAQEDFPNKVLDELITIARQQPLVLFIDGLEDAPKSVREQLESHLLARFGEAPLAMVVSASRATLRTSWSPELLHGRFDKWHLLPLSSQEVDLLLEDSSASDRQGATQILGGPLMKYVRDIGQGHPVVVQLVVESLSDLMADDRDPTSIHTLNEQQSRELIEDVYRGYLEPYALRDLGHDPWAERVYKMIVPMRYFDLQLLELLLRACGVETLSAEERPGRAVNWLEERGLIHWTPAGVYKLDTLPRDLLVRRMAHFEPETLRVTTKALIDLYQSQIFAAVDVPNRPLATVEYLYHRFIHKRLQGVSQARIETDILEDLKRCLVQNRSPRAIDTLWRYLREDHELARIFGPSLRFKVIATVERLSQADIGLSAPELAQEKEALVREALSGNCILFLGPELTIGPKYLDVYATLAERLAEESGCTEAPAKFEEVAQYYVKKMGPERLAKEFKQYVESLLDPDRASLDAIVSLPFHTIVTTATDQSLEHAYERSRWPLEVTISATASPKIERGKDLLIKLCGSLDLPGSLVLTRRENLQFRTNLTGADNLLDSYLRAGVPLFIGFSLRDPLLYFLHALVHGSTTLTAGRSFVASDESLPFFTEAWQADLVILNQPGKDLLKELQEQWQDWRSEEMRILSGAEVLEEVRAGRPVAGRRMSRMELEEGTNMEGQDLRNCVITSGTLNGVLLNHALLDRADMSNVALEDAQLRHCRANGVNLIYARANRAKLDGAQFRKALFTGATMQDVEVTNTVFAESDLIYTDLRGARGDGTAFINANLSKAELSGAQLPGAVFRDSLVWGGVFKRARLPKADFSLANLAEAQFEGADLTGANFYFANLAGADFSGADVRGANFSQARLEGADFHDAKNVMEAKFTGAIWQDARLPAELRRRLEQTEAAMSHTRLQLGELVELTHEVMSGGCILFVGPGLTLGPHYLDTYAMITTRLARECGWAENQAGLSDVAQYYAAKKGRERLLKSVSGEILSSLRVDETSLDLIVSLPFDVIVTTTADTSLEQAYERAQRRYERAASLDSSLVVEQDEDLIVRLCGGIDIPDSPLVLTRRDRLQLQAKLAQGDNLLSRYIGARAPLFVGFSLRDPMLYVLHTLVSRPNAPMGGKSFVALDESHPFLGEAWETEGLLVLDRSSRELLEEFQGRWLERMAGELRIWSATEVLEAIRAGQSVAGRHMNGIVLEEGADLQGQDLRNCVITSGTLNGVLLNDALLQGADLSNIELEDAQLSRCQLLGANMVYAKVNRAKLDGADLGKVLLIYAALQDVELTGARLAEADLIFSDLRGAFGEDVDFTRANLSHILLSGARLPGARFRDCFCASAKFKRAELSGADFHMANLLEAKFEGANLTDANFHSANLTGADFSGADVRGADFSQARLNGADLRDAKNVLEADFTGSAWQEAKLSEELRQRLEQAEAEGHTHSQ